MKSQFCLKLFLCCLASHFYLVYQMNRFTFEIFDRKFIEVDIEHRIILIIENNGENMSKKIKDIFKELKLFPHRS